MMQKLHCSVPFLARCRVFVAAKTAMAVCSLCFFAAPWDNVFSEEPTPSPTATEENKSEKREISIPVPEGQDVTGIRIPHHNERGELILLISAEVARKANDDELEMERMKVDLWEENDRAMTSLSMPKSRFHIPTRTLSGNDGAQIVRDDFVITGQNLEFDLDGQKGIMRGKVTMTIKSAETLAQ